MISVGIRLQTPIGPNFQSVFQYTNSTCLYAENIQNVLYRHWILLNTDIPFIIGHKKNWRGKLCHAEWTIQGP